MSSDTPREAIEQIIDNTARPMSQQIGYTQKEVWLDNPDDTADAIIKYLWKKASDPEIVEAIAKFGVEDWDRYVPDGPLQDGLRQRAKGEIAELLTLLIGPPPSK